VLRIHEILLRIRMRIWIPLFFASDLQEVKKKFFCLFYFLNVHLHHFSKIKSHKRSHKTVGINVFSYYFCLMIEGSKSWFVSVSLTNGFGSGRPKNIWILRIRIRNTACVMRVWCLGSECNSTVERVRAPDGGLPAGGPHPGRPGPLSQPRATAEICMCLSLT
jgi:hypothetical protein